LQENKVVAAEIAARVPSKRNNVIDAGTLAVVTALADGELTVLELAGVMGVPPATSAEWVSGASQAGLVSKRRSLTDRRRWYLSLTAKGQQMTRSWRTCPRSSVG